MGPERGLYERAVEHAHAGSRRERHSAAPDPAPAGHAHDHLADVLNRERDGVGVRAELRPVGRRLVGGSALAVLQRRARPAADRGGGETSFDLLAPRGEELVEIFYRRLFAAAPAVRPLFAGTDMRRQKTKLLAPLVLPRKSLPDLEAIVPKLWELGGATAPMAHGSSASRWWARR